MLGPTDKPSVAQVGKWRSRMAVLGADQAAMNIVAPTPPDPADTCEDYARRFREWTGSLTKS